MQVREGLYRAGAFLRHQLTAWNTGGEGIHSPSLFYLVRMVIYDDNEYYAYRPIEQQRLRLSRATKTISFTDYGSGGSGERRLSLQYIVRTHAQKPRMAQLLFRLANYLTETESHPLTIVELGTSLGLTTAYLASPSKANEVLTFDGAEEVVREAKIVWEKVQVSNIRAVAGDIDKTLAEHLPQHIDLAYIDANHTYEATMHYVRQIAERMGERSLVVIDDIHYSREMQRAWQDCCRLPQVTAALDLFRLGILCFEPHLPKKVFKLRYL